MIDRKFVGSPRPFDKGAERDRFAGVRRVHINAVECTSGALQLGQNLQHHVIAVELREVLRHLTLSERIVKRIVDQLRLNAEARRLVAVDGQGQRCAAGLLVGRDVAQLGQCLHLVEKLG